MTGELRWELSVPKGPPSDAIRKIPTREEIKEKPTRRGRWAKNVPIPTHVLVKTKTQGVVRKMRAGTLRAVLGAITERVNTRTLELGRVDGADYRVTADTLMREAGIGSRSTFFAAVQALVDRGLLHRQSGQRAGSRYGKQLSQRNVYRICPWMNSERELHCRFVDGEMPAPSLEAIRWETQQKTLAAEFEEQEGKRLYEESLRRRAQEFRPPPPHSYSSFPGLEAAQEKLKKQVRAQTEQAEKKLTFIRHRIMELEERGEFTAEYSRLQMEEQTMTISLESARMVQAATQAGEEKKRRAEEDKNQRALEKLKREYAYIEQRLGKVLEQDSKSSLAYRKLALRKEEIEAHSLWMRTQEEGPSPDADESTPASLS